MEFTEQQISAVARVLSDRAAEDCGVDKDDNWKTYSENYLNDAHVALGAIAAAPQVVADERALPEPVTYMLRHPGCVTGLTESGYNVAMHKLLNMPAGSALVNLYTEDQMRAAREAAPVQPVAVPDGWNPEGYADSKERCRKMLLRHMKDLGLSDGNPGWIEHSDEGGKIVRDTLSFEGELLFAFQVIGDALQAAPAAQGDATRAEIDVLAERKRQIEVEGRSADDDDRYTDCELARAAATYALCTEPEQLKLQGVAVWPWNRYWWKFTDYRRNLVKSGALIIAEIERIDRAAIAATAAS